MKTHVVTMSLVFITVLLLMLFELQSYRIQSVINEATFMAGYWLGGARGFDEGQKYGYEKGYKDWRNRFNHKPTKIGPRKNPQDYYRHLVIASKEESRAAL